ncbi:SDR family oxidoreductase [Endozoicomonas ascidiicola]|uniref:SDR family oxidoreductase n=1 Tax=Endozoicomonas ascidiicola TaxID=1698521 RepID=UPI00082F9D3A|nr:SDR family oxidoreductase [Endozoicomonas ascidiicola]
MPVTAVTGSASGIGAAVCKVLSDAGHQVIGIDRANAEVNADLSTPAGRDAAINEVLTQCDGKLDGLICCAGLGVTAPDSGLVVSVNYFGATSLVEGLQTALEKGEKPAILIIGSVAANQQLANQDAMVPFLLDNDEASAVKQANDSGMPHIAYSASKYAVTVFARKKAVEYGKKGIRINVVAPGAVETPLLNATLEDPRFGEATRNFVAPLGRAGSPEEIAQVIAFMQSDKASFIHGSVFFVDGGMDAMVRSVAF